MFSGAAEATVRLEVAWGGMALVVMLGGCTSPAGQPSWQGSAAPSGSAPVFAEPVSYSYVLTRGCDPAAPLGRYRITVRNGTVTSSERLAAAGTAAPSAGGTPDVDLGPVGGQVGEEIDVPTLGELLELARTAADDGGAVTKSVDPVDGHPVRVTIDVESPECFTVSDYRL